jgi:hypothetical protein
MAGEFYNGILVDLDGDGGRLVFKHNPSEINDNKAVEWEAVGIMGFSDPRFQFNNSGERTINFTLKLLGLENADRTYVRKTVNWLRSLEYPDYMGAGDRMPPPRVLFMLGQLYSVTCIVRAVNARYLTFEGETGLPTEADVDIVLAQWTEKSLTPGDIRI